MHAVVVPVVASSRIGTAPVAAAPDFMARATRNIDRAATPPRVSLDQWAASSAFGCSPPPERGAAITAISSSTVGMVSYLGMMIKHFCVEEFVSRWLNKMKVGSKTTVTVHSCPWLQLGMVSVLDLLFVCLGRAPKYRVRTLRSGTTKEVTRSLVFTSKIKC